MAIKGTTILGISLALTFSTKGPWYIENAGNEKNIFESEKKKYDLLLFSEITNTNTSTDTLFMVIMVVF